MLRATSHPELTRWFVLPSTRWQGGCPQLRDFASSRMAILGGNRDLALGASFLLSQKFNSGLKVFPRRLHDRRLGGPKEEGRDSLTPEEPGGREDFAPEGQGIPDLISSEYVRRRHLTNFRFTSSSSELSLGRIHAGRTTKVKLETSHDFRRLNSINPNRNSCRFS